MTTVCIDGNYLFHKSFAVFSGFGSKDPGDVLSSEGDKNIFMRKIITDMCYGLNKLPDVNRIIFCKDSKSWRKDYEITRSVYKESRKQSKDVNWGSFFQLMDDFGKFLESMGFIYTTYPGAEGDDLLWAWGEHLKKTSDDNVIMLSGDQDIHQLVHSNADKWTIVWANKSKTDKISVDADWSLNEEREISIFDVTPSTGESTSKLEKLLQGAELNKVNVKEYVFKKILIGDKKDDVPGVFPFKKLKDKNGVIKNGNITPGKADKIWELYNDTIWGNYTLEDIWEDDEFLEWISGVSLRLIKQTDNQENRDKFKGYYIENAILVWLNINTIPQDLSEEIFEHIKKSEESAIPKLITDKKLMIESSPWGDISSTPKQFDPFNIFE